MSTWLKEWSAQLVVLTAMVIVVLTAMVTSSVVIPAASIERSRYLEDQSCQIESRNDAVEDAVFADTHSNRVKALQALFVLSKAGLKIVKAALKFVRRYPGPALASVLALQNRGSLLKVPFATALYVQNINQNITSNETIVPLIPMITTVGNDVTACGGFVFRDVDSGNISSSCPLVAERPFTFYNMTCGDSPYPGWVTGGFQDELNHILNCAFVTRALGYYNTIYINSTLEDFSGNKVQGLIQINWPPDSIPSTSVMIESQSTTDTSIRSLTIPGTNSQATQSLSRVSNTPLTATFIQQINTSSSVSQKVTQSLSDASSTPLATATSNPSYAIIGGALAGGVLLCGIITGIVAYVRGWRCLPKESSSPSQHTQDSGIEHTSPDIKSPDYGLIVVTQPLNLKNSEYDDLSAASGRSQSNVYTQPDSTSRYGSLSLAPL